MSRLPLKIKEEAISLRKRGYSIKEVADNFKIAKSTSSLWLRDISLNKKAKERLARRKLLSNYKTSLRWQIKRKEEKEMFRKKALEFFNKLKKNKRQNKVYCALLFWCEGSKRVKEGLRLINSDPLLIKTFISLLRKSFEINERKFRVGLHLHQYHNEKKQKEYWSKITKIPKKQFIRVYWKPSAGKRIREDYPGCATIYYHDNKLAKELVAIYEVFSELLTK